MVPLLGASYRPVLLPHLGRRKPTPRWMEQGGLNFARYYWLETTID